MVFKNYTSGMLSQYVDVMGKKIDKAEELKVLVRSQGRNCLFFLPELK